MLEFDIHGNIKVKDSLSTCPKSFENMLLIYLLPPSTCTWLSLANLGFMRHMF